MSKRLPLKSIILDFFETTEQKHEKKELLDVSAKICCIYIRHIISDKCKKSC